MTILLKPFGISFLMSSLPCCSTWSNETYPLSLSIGGVPVAGLFLEALSFLYGLGFGGGGGVFLETGFTGTTGLSETGLCCKIVSDGETGIDGETGLAVETGWAGKTGLAKGLFGEIGFAGTTGFNGFG